MLACIARCAAVHESRGFPCRSAGGDERIGIPPFDGNEVEAQIAGQTVRLKVNAPMDTGAKPTSALSLARSHC
nr:hypothetical protein [uncultured Sphingomonas sp.]